MEVEHGDEEILAADAPAEVPAVVVHGEGQRNLRDRTNLRRPDRYGDPVAHLAESAPGTYNDAISSDKANHWKVAMKEEI